MKRYYVLLLCLAAAGGCNKQQNVQTKTANAIQQGNDSNEPWMGADTADPNNPIAQTRIDEAKRLDPAEAEHMGLPEQLRTTGNEEQMTSSGERVEDFDDAAAEKQGEGALPAHREKGELASTGPVSMDTGVGTSSALPPSFGNPPGAFTAPGTTRAVTPTQGTLKNSTTLKGTDVLEGTNEKPASRQGSSDSDKLTTQRIRRSVLDDDKLSYVAKNVRITTRDGNITLSGVVTSEQERWEIERKARGYAGSGTVDNRIELKNNPVPQSSLSN